jgi:DNA-directed RNA polymerase subunit RPC12/RpoP
MILVKVTNRSTGEWDVYTLRPDNNGLYLGDSLIMYLPASFKSNDIGSCFVASNRVWLIVSPDDYQSGKYDMTCPHCGSRGCVISINDPTLTSNQCLRCDKPFPLTIGGKPKTT